MNTNATNATTTHHPPVPQPLKPGRKPLSKKLDTKDVSHLAFSVLHAMKKCFQSEIRIFTNANKELATLQAPTSDEEFTKLFAVTHAPNKSPHKTKDQAWIIFRIGKLALS
jgi:hypothetical protein